MAVAMIIMMCPARGLSQRRVTPVEPTTTNAPTDPTAKPEVDKSKLVEMLDSKGNTILVDTITGREYVDSTAIAPIPKMIYPRIYQLSVGLNIWDPFMRIIGQQYGVASVWGQLSMHNRYFPYIEVGLGTADITPDGMNFTFKSPLAPFFKIGATYNMFYNSNPDYQFHAGLRYGFTPFKYSVDNITADDPYWGEQTSFSITRQNATAGYLEVAVGVKVKIVSRLSLGWTFMYHTILHESKRPVGEPMYIPGYGKRGSSVTGQFSVIWTMNLNKPAPVAVDTDEQN